MVVPLYTAQLDNAIYFIPLFADPTQTLWRNDGSTFNLTCEGITLESGELLPLPKAFPPEEDCQNVTATAGNASACFVQRFPSWDPVSDEVICQQANVGQRRQVAGDSGVESNLTEIADRLAALVDAASLSADGTAAYGLAAVGCAAQAALQQITAYYFNMAYVLSAFFAVCSSSVYIYANGIQSGKKT